jgi:Family of unknown function (DUF6228)
MNQHLHDVLERAGAWPEQAQEELRRVALSIELALEASSSPANLPGLREIMLAAPLDEIDLDRAPSYPEVRIANSQLIFRLVPRIGAAPHEVCSVRVGRFSGTVNFESERHQSPSAFFREIAEQWRGWQGTKEWFSGEGSVSLTATSTSLGPIELTVDLIDDGVENVNRVRCTLIIESSELDAIALNMQRVFPERNAAPWGLIKHLNPWRRR